ncbi:MAG: hypothetical protein J6M60_02330 [Clostridia bacterium]|nr:hypothetical protein [Clostridia bacterium]
MDYEHNKEIMELIKNIKEINEQMYNPNEKIRKILMEIQEKMKEESSTFELISVNGDISKITTIDNIDINILYSKLPFYKSLCEAKLLEKCGRKLYDEICKKENIK